MRIAERAAARLHILYGLGQPSHLVETILFFFFRECPSFPHNLSLPHPPKISTQKLTSIPSISEQIISPCCPLSLVFLLASPRHINQSILSIPNDVTANK
ncbi:hypothetical protein GDO86_011730 [Hymenochirus boettgeri]|uniref:Uncharacterized protein n=1 Tax=Hymenochirus boettgeri TaxID=247094 RepID=A0A8T2JFF1_9PIPI|nr:hypothetical protein GDO86_011730 [Hymenochirus boettgeri]